MPAAAIRLAFLALLLLAGLLPLCAQAPSFRPPYPPGWPFRPGHYRGYFEHGFDNLLAVLEKLKGKFLLSCFRTEGLAEAVRRNGWEVRELERMVSAWPINAKGCRPGRNCWLGFTVRISNIVDGRLEVTAIHSYNCLSLKTKLMITNRRCLKRKDVG